MAEPEDSASRRSCFDRAERQPDASGQLELPAGSSSLHQFGHIANSPFRSARCYGNFLDIW